MKDKDAKLLWEAYDSHDNPHHKKEVKKLKRENPQLPLMRAKAKMEMGIKLTDADRAALKAHGLTEDSVPEESRTETFEQYSIEDLAGMIIKYRDQLDPEHEYEIKRYLAMALSDLGGTLHETREAPKGKHYTKRGALKSGDADADGDGGPKFRSDPTDKPGPGD